MIKTIALIAGLLIGAVLLFAASRPDTFSVQRSVHIQAPAEKIFPLINEMQRFNTWNPFDKKDPQIKGSYRGPASGPGAVYDFAGDNNVGKGSLQITAATAPRQVSMQLDMQEPMAASNSIEFTLVPQGDATEVTWAMHGPSPFLTKLIHLVFNMDRMIGGDFETGLASLKGLAERP